MPFFVNLVPFILHLCVKFIHIGVYGTHCYMNSIPCICQNLFIYSTLDGHLGSFQFGILWMELTWTLNYLPRTCACISTGVHRGVSHCLEREVICSDVAEPGGAQPAGPSESHAKLILSQSRRAEGGWPACGPGHSCLTHWLLSKAPGQEVRKGSVRCQGRNSPAPWGCWGWTGRLRLASIWRFLSCSLMTK